MVEAEEDNDDELPDEEEDEFDYGREEMVEGRYYSTKLQRDDINLISSLP